MRRLSLAVEAANRAAVSREIAAAVESLPQFVEARTVALFCSLADEVATDEWLAAWGGRCRLVVPRVEGETMRFYDYQPSAMCRGSFNILEPAPSDLSDANSADVSSSLAVANPVEAPSNLCVAYPTDVPSNLCDPADIDLIVVPGVAFTAAGARLGRGRGYYDRYLSQPEMRAYTVGVCYAHQIVDALPSEPHDVAVERVICGRSL